MCYHVAKVKNCWSKFLKKQIFYNEKLLNLYWLIRSYGYIKSKTLKNEKNFLLFLFVLTFSLESCVVRQVASEPNLVVVKKAPRNHQVVFIKKKKYYRWGGKYYRKTRRGYVVVHL